MHIAISYPVDTVKKSYGKPKTVLGRAVANHGFLFGLAQANVGHRVTLFVPSRQDVDLLENTLLAEIQATIHVIPRFRIAAYIEQYPIDILHFMDPKMMMGGLIRNLLAEHDFVITGMTHSLGDQIMECFLLNHANGIEPGDCLVCTTPTAQTVVASMYAFLAGHHPGLSLPQTEVIPLGVDLAAFREPSALARQDLDLPAEDFVILSLARFNPLFKMDLLPVLILFSMLLRQCPRPVRLVLAGSEADGRYIRFLRDWAYHNGIGDSVQFVMSPTDEQKIALYQHANIFLSLSDNVQETFGLTVIEALASGLPAVVSDWNGYKSLVEHEVTGIRIPTKMLGRDDAWEGSLSLQPLLTGHMLCAQTTAIDLPLARDAILKLEADREGLGRMSRAAAASAVDYDWKKVLSRYLALWQRLREKQLASVTGESERNRRTSYVRFLHEFSSYPSSQLLPGDCFVTSEFGRLVLDGKQSIQPYEEMQDVLDLRLLYGILKNCLQTRSVRELMDATGPGGTRQDAFSISRNLIWLYKYGYLEAL